MRITLTVILSLLTLNSYGSNLKKDLKAKLTAGHEGLDYSHARKVLFGYIDNYDGIVCSVYTPHQCQNRSQTHLKKRRARGFKLNIEHTWPQSKGAKVFPAKSDMHHLFVTSKESNSIRGNLPFCNVESSFWELGGSLKGIDLYSQDCFEPQDDHKGNVARAYFYFSIRYDLPITVEQETVLRKWNQQDPIDEEEEERNLKVQEIQGNLNLFITHPELINKIKNFQ